MKKYLTKIIEFIKKHDNIFVIMLIFLSIAGITLNVLIANSDELWNFQNVYKIYNGFQIYQDANVIVTPLFFGIGELLFEILGASFLSFRIYNVLIMAILYFITYLILKKIGISKKMSIITILVLIVLKNYEMILVQANYNNLALMLCLIGILLNLNKSKNNSIIQATILFLVFITKQNIGIYYGIGLFVSELLNENNVKNKIKNLIKEFIIFITFCVLLLIYFYGNNNLNNFINYAFLGISQFAEENISIDILDLFFALLFIIMNISLSIVFIKNKKISINKIEKNNILVLNCFSIPLSLIMYPILNDAHFLIGIYASILLFIYLIVLMINKIEIKINKNILNTILISFSIITVTISTMNFYSWISILNSVDYKLDIKNPYYGGIIDEELLNNINEVVAFIQKDSDEVVVLSSKAAFYMIPMKLSNGMMDLPLKGNLGKNGEEGLINQIKNMKNAKILIEKDEENLNWQESKFVREYIINNMEEVGEIEEFLVYKEK